MLTKVKTSPDYPDPPLTKVETSLPARSRALTKGKNLNSAALTAR
jgi:hypothetical protein